MSIKKGHGLHKIPFSHAKTFKKLDEAIFIILQDASDQKLFECIFKEKNLMISFEKFWNDKKIQINVINAFLLNKMQYKLRLETEFHIDEKGSKFKVIKMS